MVNKARQDFVELSYVYGIALCILVFLIITSTPIQNSKLGLIIPQKEVAPSVFFASDAFDGIDIHAKAYVVYDLIDKKIIASKNAEEVLPLASITKLMTAVTALSHFDKDKKIIIEDKSVEDGYDLGLVKNQTWKLQELLKYTLVFSSNDGAHAIADNLGGRGNFVAQMNNDSILLGLGMTFTDPAGLDIGENIGGKGTALDVAQLFGIARKRFPEVLEATTKTRVSVTANSKDKITGIPNTNQEIVNLFGAEASKTGFTDSAGGNLGVVVDIALGHPVVIVVLGSTREERFTDTEKLYKALLESIH
jgi:D-alanyl-D-alanine endopeptidase (penicillin-binding protein 7)